MDSAHDLLTDIDAAYAELSQAIDGIPEPRMTDVWLGTWGTREVLVHIAGWQREMIPALHRIGRGEPPHREGVSYDDFDAWNARFVEARRGVKVADVLAELADAHRAFVAAAAALPAEHLVPGGPARELVEGVGAPHYREHAAQIREWRRAHGV